MAPRILRDTLAGQVGGDVPDAGCRRRRRGRAWRGWSATAGAASHRHRCALTPRVRQRQLRRKSCCRWSIRRSCRAGNSSSTTSVDQGSQAGDLLGIALLRGKDPKVPVADDAARHRAGDPARHRLHHLRHRRTSAPRTPRVIVTGGALRRGRRQPGVHGAPGSRPGWPRTAGTCSQVGTGRPPAPRRVAVIRSDAGAEPVRSAPSTTSTPSPSRHHHRCWR